MHNINSISRKTVESIVKLRDEGNTWDEVANQVGYISSTCKSHYDIAKANKEIFYFSDFLDKLKIVDPEFITMKEGYNIAKSMGYLGTYNSFRERNDVKRIPFFKSIPLKEQKIKRVLRLLKASPNSSLRELVRKTFPEYSIGGQHQIYHKVIGMLNVK